MRGAFRLNWKAPVTLALRVWKGTEYQMEGKLILCVAICVNIYSICIIQTFPYPFNNVHNEKATILHEWVVSSLIYSWTSARCNTCTVVMPLRLWILLLVMNGSDTPIMLISSSLRLKRHHNLASDAKAMNLCCLFCSTTAVAGFRLASALFLWIILNVKAAILH